MAYNMNVSGRYGTHLPCLIRVMERTKGDVLELGMGIFSTPYLHYKCMLDKRKLVSYENYHNWYKFFIKYEYPNEYHEVNYIEKYSDAKIDKPWDLVLVDQTPDSSRAEETRRLAKLAQYIVIHDSNDDKERYYHFSTIYPLFKYKVVWNKDNKFATVLSNYHDLTDLFL